MKIQSSKFFKQGYICQLLNYLYGYKILGLESSLRNVEAAKKRQKDIFPESLSSVKYVHYSITEESSRDLESILRQNFDQVANICLMGLHACGDLSVHMSKMYKDMEMAKIFILVSCCYHKLSLKITEKSAAEFEDGAENFNYFPLSDALKDTLKGSNENVGTLFGRTFMRLACQETSERWTTMSEKSHNEHAFHVLSRGTLELYASESNCLLFY